MLPAWIATTVWAAVLSILPASRTQIGPDGHERFRDSRPHAQLLDAMRLVESRGNDRAVGDFGRSKGPYQCGRDAWADACRHAGVRWRYDRLVWDRAASEQVMRWYWALLGCRTDEQRARVWCGGPSGMAKPATLAYWRRVQAAMRSLSR